MYQPDYVAFLIDGYHHGTDRYENIVIRKIAFIQIRFHLYDSQGILKLRHGQRPECVRNLVQDSFGQLPIIVVLHLDSPHCFFISTIQSLWEIGESFAHLIASGFISY
jgi:hypothetical protein